MTILRKVAIGITSAGIAALGAYEGTRLTTYLDSAGVPTVCTGHTGPDVKLGQRYTKEQCDMLLRQDLKWAEAVVSEVIKVDIPPQSRDALIIFTFNVGPQAFRKSTLAKLVNKGQLYEAADEFLKWTKITDPKTGKLKVLPGLVNRRLAERAMFLDGLNNNSKGHE